ncbi:tetratricopeptide repeat protein [Nitratifractor sp.]
MKSFKIQRIEDAVKGFVKHFGLGKEEWQELLSLLHRIEKEDPKILERSKKLDLLAASIVWAYLRWAGLNGQGGITMEMVANYFGVYPGSVQQKASSIDRILDERYEEFLIDTKEGYATPLNFGKEDYNDIDRFPVQEKYWNLLEREDNYSDKEMIGYLESLIRIDPDFFDPYILLYDLYREEGNKSAAAEILTKGYQRALSLLGVAEGDDLPGIPWGFIENRHIVRILYHYATYLWEKGLSQEALAIYEKLLCSNPEDNVGARYAMAAILDGYVNHDAFEEAFLDSEGYGLDPVSLDLWFQRVALKHPERFGWWKKWIQDQGLE